MIPVYTEFLSAFCDLGYDYKIIKSLKDITDDSIVFMSNNFHVNNPGELLYKQAPNAIYIGWYWHEQNVSMLKRFVYTGENVFKMIPTHAKSFPLHKSVKNFVPLLLRTNEHPNNIGKLERTDTQDYCYMGGRYKADWVPGEPFKGLYHGVYEVKYYLTSEQRKQQYLASKYALGFQSQENIDSEHVSQRIFEGLAYGCLVFSESYPAHQQTDGLVINVTSKKDIEEKMDFYNKNPQLRKEIQEKGYEFSRKFGTNRYSMKLFLEKFKELFDIDL